MKRVEIGKEEVNVVFKINTVSPESGGASDRNSKSLQHCCRRMLSYMGSFDFKLVISGVKNSVVEGVNKNV